MIWEAQRSKAHRTSRKATALYALVVGAALGSCFFLSAEPRPTTAAVAPVYDKDGSLLLPATYREWTFLSSGVDMVYGPAAKAGGDSTFDNVFALPAAYRSYLANGTWPDKTVLVLEVRGADTNPSINHGGHSQSTERMGLEVHVKDTARFTGGWAFFDVNDAGRGRLIPQPASCYTCHQEHAAVDTTFAQFYPTLLPIARAKGTLSPAYFKELAAPAR